MKKFIRIVGLFLSYMIVIYVSSSLFEFKLDCTEWNSVTISISLAAFVPIGIIIAIQIMYGHEKQCENNRKFKSND